MASNILNETQLNKKINDLKAKKNKIVLCHGVFDLIHIGHIKHFERAREFGDILLVSVTSDKHVKKGPGTPLFNEKLRAQFLSSVKNIDFVYINNDETPINLIHQIKPNFYIKGSDYSDPSEDITGNILKEKKEVNL